MGESDLSDSHAATLPSASDDQFSRFSCHSRSSDRFSQFSVPLGPTEDDSNVTEGGHIHCEQAKKTHNNALEVGLHKHQINDTPSSPAHYKPAEPPGLQTLDPRQLQGAAPHASCEPPRTQYQSPRKLKGKAKLKTAAEPPGSHYLDPRKLRDGFVNPGADEEEYDNVVGQLPEFHSATNSHHTTDTEIHEATNFPRQSLVLSWLSHSTDSEDNHHHHPPQTLYFDDRPDRKHELPPQPVSETSASAEEEKKAGGSCLDNTGGVVGGVKAISDEDGFEPIGLLYTLAQHPSMQKMGPESGTDNKVDTADETGAVNHM